jgi:hypothetical protein
LKYYLDLNVSKRGNVTLPRGFVLHLPPGYKSKLLREIGKDERVVSNKPST